MFYSKSTNGFYVEEIHGDNMPSDVIEITQELYNQLMAEQSTGRQISSDENGMPITIEPIDTTDYKTKRGLAYPPFTDYLDGVVKGDQAQIDKYIADCLEVKTRFPKQ